MSEDWDDKDTRLKISSIIERLQWITSRAMYYDIRIRYNGDKNFDEEFENHEEVQRKIWFETKRDYCASKIEIDNFLSESAVLTEKQLGFFNSMREVIDNEIDDILLKEEVENDQEESE
jgi:hypothetical protein